MDEIKSSELTDARLIEQAKQGDQEAFGVLYERYLDVIFRYVRSRVKNAQTAEDITELVFLRSFETIHQYREKGLRYSAYLYQVARNLLIDHYRQGDEDLPIESAEHNLANQRMTDEAMVHREQVESLQAAMERLSGEYQEIIRVRVLLEVPTVEAAQWMRRSEGATRVLLHRALKALKREVESEHERNI